MLSDTDHTVSSYAGIFHSFTFGGTNIIQAKIRVSTVSKALHNGKHNKYLVSHLLTPAEALKQVSPRARLVPLQTELLSVTVVQVYGLQQVQERPY